MEKYKSTKNTLMMMLDMSLLQIQERSEKKENHQVLQNKILIQK